MKLRVMIAVAGLLFAVLFNHAMEIDKANLCRTDATAFDGC